MMSETQSLLKSTDPMKHKIIYIEGYLLKKYTGYQATENVSSEFLDKLNQGRLYSLSIPVSVYKHSQTSQTRCRSYLMKLLSYIDSQIANSPNTCKSLANILLKSSVTANSDKEQTVGLR